MSEASQTIETARNYYNSDDADNFYFTIWGGEDIHVGLYQSETHPIRDASRATVERMAGMLKGLKADATVLDIGAGFGGAARYLAKTFGCHVTCLNLSEVENNRNREMNQEQGLADQIDVVDGNFESLPFPDGHFQVVWSEDAILHAADREQVLAEVHRVLAPGGEFIFTDPMQADDCPEGVLQPIYDRIHLDSLGCPGFYKQAGQATGLAFDVFEDHTAMLTAHYSRVLAETESREADLAAAKVSPDYVERMKKGLGHWIEGGRNGHLAWGIFRFTKPA